MCQWVVAWGVIVRLNSIGLLIGVALLLFRLMNALAGSLLRAVRCQALEEIRGGRVFVQRYDSNSTSSLDSLVHRRQLAPDGPHCRREGVVIERFGFATHVRVGAVSSA